MGVSSASVNARVWAAIGLMLIVALFGVAPTVLTAPSETHAHHHAAAMEEFDHLAVADHEHIGPAALGGAPDMFADDALIPRLRIALPMSGLLLLAGVLWRWWPQITALVGRDPPRAPLMVLPGRDVLTRLCISRR